MNGPFEPLAVVVDRVGDQLLAGAVLALDQDVGLARRDALDQLEQLLHLLALADDVRELVAILELLLELLVLALQVGALDRLLEQREDALGVDRLLEEEERAGLDRLDRARDVALAADDDDLGLRVDVLEPAHQLDAVDVGQHHVGEHRVGPPRLEQLLAARADERRPHLVAGLLEHHLQPLGHRRLVVDGEDLLPAFCAHTPSGRVSRDVAEISAATRIVAALRRSQIIQPPVTVAIGYILMWCKRAHGCQESVGRSRPSRTGRPAARIRTARRTSASSWSPRRSMVIRSCSRGGARPG